MLLGILPELIFQFAVWTPVAFAAFPDIARAGIERLRSLR